MYTFRTLMAQKNKIEICEHILLFISFWYFSICNKSEIQELGVSIGRACMSLNSKKRF